MGKLHFAQKFKSFCHSDELIFGFTILLVILLTAGDGLGQMYLARIIGA